jgi:hypothetical protein
MLAAEPADRGATPARTVIPPEVWSRTELLFGGCKVYRAAKCYPYMPRRLAL